MVEVTEEDRRGREAHDQLLLEVVQQSRGKTRTTEYCRPWSPDRLAGETVGRWIRWDDPASSPIPVTLPYALLMSALAADDTVLMQMIGDWEPEPQGVHRRTRFLLPAAAPDEFLEAHRLHCIEEVQGMAKALPEFCQRTGWRSGSGRKKSDE